MSGSYKHRVRYIPACGGYYRCIWEVDRYSNRLRWPVMYMRDTDREGAKRFAKKWGIEIDVSAASDPAPVEVKVTKRRGRTK